MLRDAMNLTSYYGEALPAIDHSYSASSSREDLVVHTGENGSTRQNPHLAVAINRNQMEAEDLDEESAKQAGTTFPSYCLLLPKLE